MISCTADFYDQMIAKTSAEFLEGFVFQFPDFDDPALNESFVNFQKPNAFFSEYAKRWPGEWGAVSWEYASIMDLWRAGAEAAGSVEPQEVLTAAGGGDRERQGRHQGVPLDPRLVVQAQGHHDQALRGHGRDVLPTHLDLRCRTVRRRAITWRLFWPELAAS
jgi:hypothetical protein